MDSKRGWAVILAAGDGTRLSSLTRDANGVVIPKQFCSLNGGPSLLAQAIQRASRVVDKRQICVVVAANHANHWLRDLAEIPASHIIVQPQNCGTAHGVLLAALRIQHHDPLARVEFLPADHHVSDESILAETLCDVFALGAGDPDALTLVGIEPDDADPELGYIVPAERLSKLSMVRRFVEKPPEPAARELIAAGALWNSFIFAADLAALLRLLSWHLPDAFQRMRAALDFGWADLVELYRTLPSIDFSRSVMQPAPRYLRVVRSPSCGWCDLGTPERVAKTVRRLNLSGHEWLAGEAISTVAMVTQLNCNRERPPR